MGKSTRWSRDFVRAGSARSNPSRRLRMRDLDASELRLSRSNPGAQRALTAIRNRALTDGAGARVRAYLLVRRTLCRIQYVALGG